MDTSELQSNCTTASKEQREAYCLWMLKMKDWSIIDTRTGEVVSKGALFSRLYHTDRHILELFTRPVTDEGDILIHGYRLKKREIPDQNRSEEEVIGERATDAIRKEGVKFLLSQKLNPKKTIHQFSYEELLELMTAFGKERVFDMYDKLNATIEDSFK